MSQRWFQFFLRICIIASIGGFVLSAIMWTSAYAQTIPTTTPSGPSPFITVTYIEPINVRTGPSTVYYPIIGQLPVGATAPALGVSPSHAWIQIAYPSGPGGTGWVYAANVTLAPGYLQVVEPPPTATPPATPTIDPTLAAQFNIQPTITRLPTFTPPAPLTIPTFPKTANSPIRFPMGGLIVVLALVGMLVLLVSLFSRR